MGKFSARRFSFWTLDLLTGRKKRKSYNDIVSRGNRSGDDLLTDMLKYAIDNVPLYSEIPAPELSLFPVASKTFFRSHSQNEYISREYADKKLHTVYTGGSTGEPFRIVQSPDKRIRTITDLIHAHDEIGWHIGDRFIFIRYWTSNYSSSPLKSFMQNVTTISISDFGDDKKAEIAESLCSHKNTVVFGYSSAIQDFAEYILCHNILPHKLSVKLVVCDSDELTAAACKKIEKAFGCPVYNRYDNEENGFVGMACGEDGSFRLNTQSLFFELLKLDCDEPCEPGEIGRIVVTDLFNHAMPLIRYDLGDLGVSSEHGSCVSTLSSLCGRSTSSLTDTSGKVISTVSVSVAFEVFTGITRYQLIQNEKVYTTKYTGSISADEKDKLMLRLISLIGSDADIRIEHCDVLPSAKNGKFQTVINESCGG